MLSTIADILIVTFFATSAVVLIVGAIVSGRQRRADERAAQAAAEYINQKLAAQLKKQECDHGCDSAACECGAGPEQPMVWYVELGPDGHD